MPTRVISTGSISVDTSDFKNFARDLRAADPALAASLRKKLKEAGDIVAVDARARASFSKQIAPTIRTSVRVTSVSVSARGVLADLMELGNKGGSVGAFRHPVFGNKNVWVSQSMHPYLQPAVDAKGDEACERIFDALDDAVRVAAEGR